MNKRNSSRRRTFLPSALLLLPALLMTGAGALPAQPAAAATAIQSKIAWNKSFATAATKAKASNKLIMVDFYADW